MILLGKTKRKQDRQLLNSYRFKECLICGSTQTTVAHHIKTKGSGGPDEPWNLMPLCWNHHAEIHNGMSAFVSKYYNAEMFLYSQGWEFDEYQGRWIHENT